MNRYFDSSMCHLQTFFYHIQLTSSNKKKHFIYLYFVSFLYCILAIASASSPPFATFNASSSAAFKISSSMGKTEHVLINLELYQSVPYTLYIWPL